MSQVDMVVKLENVNRFTRRNMLVKWLKREGQAVKKGEPLCLVETHKGVIEVPSKSDGVVRRLLVTEGSFVAGLQDIAIIRMETDGNDASRLGRHP